MEPPSNTSIGILKGSPFTATTPFEVYSAGCAIGMATGSKIGAYVGGLIGVTIPAVAPLGLVYGLVKVGRTLLRK